MKKYTLTRDYPGGPERGFTIKKKGSFWVVSEGTGYFHMQSNNKFNPEHYPEYWKEVIEYSIGTVVKNSQTNSILIRKEDGWYNEPTKTSYTDEMISNKSHLTVVNKTEGVVEKDYEILSFKTPNNTSLMVGKNIQGWYTGVLEVGSNDFRNEEWLLNHGYLIESIKRLSDGEV